MEDTSYLDARSAALGLGKLLSEHNGGEVVVMDLSGLHTWTDYFVLATVTSSTHLQGLHRRIKEFSAAHNVEIVRRQRKTPSDEEWSLVDLGNVVVHLMTEKARSFYDLERLWCDATTIWKA